MQTKKYTLEWLDYTVTITLNPAKNEGRLLTGWETENIIRTAKHENERQKLFIKKQTLRLESKRRTKLINQYRTLLVMLLDQIGENMLLFDASQKHAIDACESAKTCINDILTFIDNNFGEYATQNQRLPKARLIEIRSEANSRIDILKSRLLSQIGSSHLSSIVLHALNNFTDNTHKRLITIREVNYKKELIRSLDQISVSENESVNHDELVRLLVYLNFNSRAFMNYYTQSLADHINDTDNARDKISKLLLYSKQFNQMHHKPGIALNPEYDDLCKVVGNWFVQEINYLEKKLHWDVYPLPVDVVDVDQPKPEPFNVTCFLSVDQIALILRSMDALRILQARSLNMVIKSIAPFLSTPRTSEISWKSMRNKSYAIEESDREITIKTLESMIKWIREY